VTDPDAWARAIDSDTSAAIFAQPNFYGAIEDAEALSAAAKGAEGGDPVVIAQVDPITLGILKAPGEAGVDVAVGEGQPLGNRLDFGGPSFGFFAAREEYLRRMPGRISGETVDVDGRRGFVLTLQTREQHIRRERATSNICTAQALNALAGVVYLTWLGRRGIVELGELLLARTHYARESLAALDGVSKLHDGPVIREFAVRLDADVAAVRRRCVGQGVNPGVDLEQLTGRPEDRGGLLVAITERRSRADIDRLSQTLGAAVAAERGALPGLTASPSASPAVPA
jgi:glycine dehydrogenase subunit 1